MRTKRILAVALMAAVGLLTLVTAAQADNRRMTTSPPVPSLTNVSATTQTPALFTILSGTTATEDHASAAPQAPATQPSPDYAAQMAGNESGGTYGFTAASATAPPPV
jgi:hypothetical protein